LLVCSECGSNYRRITRASGEVVWRCADRVEKGKQSICKRSQTFTDIDIKHLICIKLGLQEFNELSIRQDVLQISIESTREIRLAPALSK
ncbi:MAG: zinc ribbon domain-containing protein, partial [Christensenellaceae bacterium]